MARWIGRVLLIFLGILTLAASVIQDVDKYGSDEGNTNADVHSIAASGSTTKPKNKPRTSTGTHRRKKSKKHKKPRYYDHPDKRPSSASTSSSTRSPYKGTGGLGPGTWVAAFQTGRVFKGRSYFNTSRYKNNPEKMPTICENRNLTLSEDSENTTGPVLFYCPGDNDTDNFDHCCGDVGFEYCCSFEGPNTALILGILSALVAVAVIIFGCCIWKKIHQKSELDMDKQPADQVVSANLTDPMLPPAIVTSPPPPPQTTTAPPGENLGLPPIDGNYGGYPQLDQVQPPQSDGIIPPQTSPKDHLVINSSEPLPPHPPPEAV